MAQELVLVPKSKYEHLLAESKKCENHHEMLDESQQRALPSETKIEQNGGKLVKPKKKRLYVKRLNSELQMKHNKTKCKQTTMCKHLKNAVIKTNNKTKWITYCV